MLRVITVCLICLLPMWAFTQSDLFKGLAKEMTSAEREASGVGALSGEQQEFLDNWLRDRFLSTELNTATPVGDVKSMGAATLSDVEQEKAIEAEVERRVNDELAAAEEL